MRGREQLLDDGSSSPMDGLQSAQQSMDIIVLLLKGRRDFCCDDGKWETGAFLLSENVGNSGSGKICIYYHPVCLYLFVDLYGYLIR